MSIKSHARGGSRGRGLFTSASLAALTAAALAAAPSSALVPRDDVGADGAVDVNNVWAGVGQMFNRRQNANGSISTFLCTGQLINPRTVIFAQHCTAGVTDEGYGPGLNHHMGFGFNPLDTLSGFEDWRRDENGVIHDPITGLWESLPEQHFYNVLQVESVFNVTEFFPGGDIVMASFDTPVIGLPTYGMLFSPLSGPTHAALVGYGTTGNGTLGPVLGIDFKRRAGENMIDGLYSQNDYLSAAFAVPGFGFGTADSAQLLYHIDFDNPNRIANDCARDVDGSLICNTPPFNASVFTLDGTTIILPSEHLDWYPGDALPRESGTAGGDSGSALFADDIFHRPLVTGVLSGGWVDGLASPNGGYSDVSYYNPLFLFRDWIVENNPYVYAGARHGSRNWSDARHWVQNMDPNYFYIDRHGRVRNGLPAAAEPGYFADDPKWGTVFDSAIPDDVEGDTGPDLLLGDIPAGSSLVNNSLGVLDDPEHGGGGGFGDRGSSSSGPTASNGSPTGPGSRNFVPNNSFGSYGSWTGAADGIARFYDVTLNNVGTTRLDMNVEIDNLTISGHLSGLDVRSGYQLNSLVAVDQFRGYVNVDGTVETREYMLWGGVLSGNGSINAASVFNVDGVITAGGIGSVGDMTINGDYIQSSHGDMLINIRRHHGNVTNDFIQVNGDASLAGDAIVAPVNFQSRPRWQDVYTVLNANNVVGNFDDVDLLFTSPILFGESVVQANGDVDIVVQAHHIGHIFGQGHRYHSLGRALDNLRFGGHFNAVADVFDLIDSSSFASFEGAMFSLTPHGAFSQTNSVISFNNSFAGHLANRGAELRAGSRGLSTSGLSGAFATRGSAGSALPAQTGLRTEAASSSPIQLGERFGMFISARGSLDNGDMGAETGFDYDPFARITEAQGDLAIGADYRLTDNLAVGLALTTSRYDLTGNGMTPLSNESVGAAAYATAFGEGWYVDGYYGFAHQDFEMERLTTSLTGNPSIAFGAPEGDQTLAGLRTGWSFSPADGLAIGPVASLNYSQMRLGAYRELAANDFNLNVDERELTSVTVEAGAEFRFNHVNRRGHMFSAFGDLSIVRELGDRSDIVTAAFAAAPGERFTVEQLLDDEWYSASAGFSYALSPNLQTRFQLTSDFDRGPLDNHYATVGFDWRF